MVQSESSPADRTISSSVIPNQARSGIINALRILFELDSDEPSSRRRGNTHTCEDQIITEHEQEWVEYIRNDADIGIITLAKYHHSENFYLMYYFKGMLIVMIIAQWLIPIILTFKATKSYMNLGWGMCPNNAPAPTRVQTFAIGLVYTSKISFLVAKKLKDMHCSPLLNETRSGGKIQIFVAMDRFMYLFYEVLVYLVNMWIVFLTLDPLDIVFNSLAIEFVVILDDEIKNMYIALFPPEKKQMCLEKYKKGNNENGKNPIKRWQFCLVKVIYNVNLWSIPFFILGFFILFIFSLVCKPGGEPGPT